MVTRVTDGCVWKYHGGSGGATGNVTTTDDGPSIPTETIRAMLTPIAVSAVLPIHRWRASVAALVGVLT
jgi:hypothetical protein